MRPLTSFLSPLINMGIAHFVAVISILTLCSGCFTTKAENNLSATDKQALMSAYNAKAQQLATDKGDNQIASFLEAMPESGAVGWAKVIRVERDPSGAVALNKDGTVVTSTLEAIGKSNSMRDIGGNSSKIRFKLAGVAIDPKTGELNVSALEGLSLDVEGSGVNTGLDSDFAAVWAGKSVAEKQASADAVAKALEARKGLVVEAISATGTAVTGVLKAVYSATPLGAGLAAVNCLVEGVGGTAERATIVQPMALPLPDKAATATK